MKAAPPEAVMVYVAKYAPNGDSGNKAVLQATLVSAGPQPD